MPRALAALEIGVLSSGDRAIEFTRDLAAESVQRKAAAYDPTGDEHYDTISALIKSVRGSDPDAGIYWLARMLEAGEDVRFLCRRLVILAQRRRGQRRSAGAAAGRGGNASLRVRRLARMSASAGSGGGLPGLRPKSNAATVAIGEARGDVRDGRTLPVPVHLPRSALFGGQAIGTWSRL